jgi:mannose-6-phosphate isomerase-like protein (cupin superfamily)
MMTPAPRIHRATAAKYFFAEGCFITEWWNTPGDAEVSVARARVAPGVTTPWHRLRGVTERYLILEGQGHVEVGALPLEAVGPGVGHMGAVQSGWKGLHCCSKPSRNP